MITREAVADELADLEGGDQFIADLDALVQAGLIEERQRISDTRLAARLGDGDE